MSMEGVRVADVKRRTYVGVTTPAPHTRCWDDGVIDNRTESRVYREFVRRHGLRRAGVRLSDFRRVGWCEVINTDDTGISAGYLG